MNEDVARLLAGLDMDDILDTTVDDLFCAEGPPTAPVAPAFLDIATRLARAMEGIHERYPDAEIIAFVRIGDVVITVKGEE